MPGDFMFRFWGAHADQVRRMCPHDVIEESDGRGFVTWFSTERERSEFFTLLDNTKPEKIPWLPDSSFLIVMRDCNDGPDTHFNTTARVVFEHEGKTYRLRDWEFGHGYPASGIRFMLTEGNYSCDCNRSLYIASLADSSFPELECGETIKLVSLQIFKGERNATDDDDND